MALSEFTGTLDPPQSLAPFTGELDQPQGLTAFTGELDDHVSTKPEYGTDLPLPAGLKMFDGELDKKQENTSDWLIRNLWTGEPEAQERVKFEKSNVPIEVAAQPYQSALLSSVTQFGASLGEAARLGVDIFNYPFNQAVKAAGLSDKDLFVAPKLPGVEKLEEVSKYYTAPKAREKWDDQESFLDKADWLGQNLAQQAPNFALNFVSLWSKVARVVTLPIMAASSAGSQYSEDTAAGRANAQLDAVVNGLVEYATERASLGVFDKIRSVVGTLGTPLEKAGFITALAQRTGAAVTGLALTAGEEGIEETVAQYLQNLSQIHIAGDKTITPTSHVKEATILGAAGGAVMAAPFTVTSYTQPRKAQSEEPQEELPSYTEPSLTDEQLVEQINTADTVDDAIAIAESLDQPITEHLAKATENLPDPILSAPSQVEIPETLPDALGNQPQIQVQQPEIPVISPILAHSEALVATQQTTPPPTQGLGTAAPTVAETPVVAEKQQIAAPKASSLREIIEPAKDTAFGKNAAGEQLYQREDGSIYRMRFDRKNKPQGYPDFGGDLAPVELATSEAPKITSIEKPGAQITPVSRPTAGTPKFSATSITTNEANRGKTIKLEERIRVVHGSDVKITPVKLPDTVYQRGYAKDGTPENHYTLAESLSKVFKKEVVWTTSEGGIKFNGVVVSGGSLSKYVFLDVNAEFPAHTVLGHELSHHMEADNPVAYKELLRVVTPLLRGHPEYRMMANLSPLTKKETIEKEMVGDLLGDAFGDPAFAQEIFNRIGQENPSLLRQVADSINKWINALLLKLGTQPRTSKYVTDIKAVREAVAKAVTQYLDTQGREALDEMHEQQGEPKFSLKKDIKNKPLEPMDWLLGMFDANQIAEMYRKELPELTTYRKLKNQILADRNDLYEKADNFLEDLKSIKEKYRDQFARIASEATIAGVDPSRDAFFATPKIKDLEKAVEGLEKRKETHTLTEKQQTLLAEGKKRLAMKKPIYNRLRKEFLSMTPENQKLFVNLRDEYVRNADLLLKEVIAKIGRLGLEDAAEDKAIAYYTDQIYRLKNNVYFPLYRRGDLVVTANKTGEQVIVEHHETLNQAKEAKDRFDKQGYVTSISKIQSKTDDQRQEKALSEVVRLVKNKVGSDFEESEIGTLMDEISQTIIRSMPERSFIHQFTHRKDIPGYSKDFIRAYSDTMYRSSTYIANLRYADQVTSIIEHAQERLKKSRLTDSNHVALDAVMNHIVKMEKAMRLQIMKGVALSGKLAFMYMLGSTSNFVINTFQTPLFTFPWMGGRYGYVKASAALSLATASQIASIRGAKNLNRLRSVLDIRNNQTGDVLNALNIVHKFGKVDLTQTFDLIEASSTDADSSGSKLDSVVRITALPMHVSEVANRQISAIATVRLELARQKAAGEQADPTKAANAAIKALDDTHFDYSKENRALMMQGNKGRLVFMFAQYATKAAFLWAHTAKLAIGSLPENATQEQKKQFKETRKIARKQLAGMFVMQGLFAGVLGLPIFAEAFVVASATTGFHYGGKKGAYMGAAASLLIVALANAFGDDDGEDFDTEVRNFISNHAGKYWGEIIAHGGWRALGFDVASRIDASNLLRRPPSEYDKRRDPFWAWVGVIAGPMIGGLARSAAGGYEDITEGEYVRGAERLMPVKQLRDLLQAGRFMVEGVKSRSGEKITEDLTPWELGVKAFGFNPSDVAEASERNRSREFFQNVWGDRVTKLLKDLNVARYEDKDTTDAENAIDEYMRKGPPEGFEISGKTIKSSYEAYKNSRLQSEGGIRVPKKRAESVRGVPQF